MRVERLNRIADLVLKPRFENRLHSLPLDLVPRRFEGPIASPTLYSFTIT